MARPLRIEFENGLYHVTARGNERRDIFSDEKDFSKLTELLQMYAERFGVRIFCYVLMNNHYHILVETPGANITAFMHNAQSHYTNYFNRRHGRAGHLFQGRYKALIVDKETYLLELSRYIHLNPVRAGIVDHPVKWRWSSYHSYASAGRPGGAWVETGEILNYFGKLRADAVKKYLLFVDAGIGKADDKLLDGAKAQLILGPDVFVEKVKGLIAHSEKRIDSEITRGKELSRWTQKDADLALTSIAAAFRIKKKEIFKRGGYKNRARQAAIIAFHTHSCWTNTEIGNQFGVSGSAVSKIVLRLENDMRKNKHLDNDIKHILSIVSA